MPETTKILVGKIVGAQGLRGEVRVQTYTQNPVDFAQLAVSSEQLAGKTLKFIRRLNPTSTVIIAKVDGVSDRNAAENLRGTELFIDRTALPKLSDGEYYIADLIGMKVILPQKRGGNSTVIAVHNFGAGDILELEDGEMVSFAGATVDLKSKTIKL